MLMLAFSCREDGIEYVLTFGSRTGKQWSGYKAHCGAQCALNTYGDVFMCSFYRVTSASDTQIF